MVTRLSIVSLIALLAVALVAVAVAQSDSTANVEVRVWQSTEDAEDLYISARPEGGRWGRTTALDMSGLNSRETFRYGDITVAVPLPEASAPAGFTPVFGEGQHNGVHYFAAEDGFAYVYVHDTTYAEPDEYGRGGKTGYRFFLVCQPAGYVHVSIGAATTYQWQEGTFIDLTYQIGDLPLVQDSWHASERWLLNSAYLTTADLRGQSQFKVWLPNSVRTFDISGLHDTVVQANIDNCRELSEAAE